jgi:hypothetical protein
MSSISPTRVRSCHMGCGRTRRNSCHCSTRSASKMARTLHTPRAGTATRNHALRCGRATIEKAGSVPIGRGYLEASSGPLLRGFAWQFDFAFSVEARLKAKRKHSLLIMCRTLSDAASNQCGSSPKANDYSYRRATNGSTLAARRAGTQQAAAPVTSNINGTQSNVQGS